MFIGNEYLYDNCNYLNQCELIINFERETIKPYLKYEFYKFD